MASFEAVWAAIAFDSSKLGAHLCVDHIKNGMVMPLVLIMKILDDFDCNLISISFLKGLPRRDRESGRQGMR